MPSIFDMTGMGQAPLFINSRPISLDFSSRFKEHEHAFMLANDLADRSDKIRQEAAALKIPEMNGYDNDVMADYQRGISARESYQQHVSTAANVIQAARSPQALGYLSDYMAATDPTQEGFRKRAFDRGEAAKKVLLDKPGLADAPLTQENGDFMVDPYDKKRPLNWSAGLLLRNVDPKLTIHSGFGSTFDPSLSMTRTIEETDKRITDAIQTSATTASQRTGQRDAQGNPVVEGASTGPIPGMLYQLKQGGGYASNINQVSAGLDALRAGMGKEDLYALFHSKYQYLKEYQDGLEDGRFLDKNGRFDSNKVYDAMLNDKSHGLPVGTKVDKNGKLIGARGSFVDQYLMDQAKRWISTKSDDSVEWNMIDQAKRDGENTANNMEPEMHMAQYDLYHAKVARVDPKNSNSPLDPQRIGTNDRIAPNDRTTLGLVVGDQDSTGTNVAKQYGVEGIIYRPDINWLRERLALPSVADAPKTKSDYAYSTLGEVHKGVQLLTPEGKEIPTGAADGLQVVNVASEITLVPNNTFMPGVGNMQSLIDYGQLGIWTKEKVPGTGTKRPDRYTVKMDPTKINTTLGNQYTQGIARVTLRGTEKQLEQLTTVIPKDIAEQDQQDHSGQYMGFDPLNGMYYVNQPMPNGTFDPLAGIYMDQSANPKSELKIIAGQKPKLTQEVSVMSDEYRDRAGSKLVFTGLKDASGNKLYTYEVLMPLPEEDMRTSKPINVKTAYPVGFDTYGTSADTTQQSFWIH